MRFLRSLAVVLGLFRLSVSQSTLTDFSPVQRDLKALFLNSQAFWPADFDNYGPLFVRLAWHCSGSYRTFDGRGGCDGGRQRFDPERSWADNTNLDKARKLLEPIKAKYGSSLSWGDLIVLAGTTAIESMGGPVLGFCGGRIDDVDGTESLQLGPSTLQSKLFPCPTNGNCTSPIGTTTIGLIYVNPEGPFGVPNPSASSPEVRSTFGRMAMNDMETVALIGGGHAFGKAHGACTTGPGPAPNEQPDDPWPGTCGAGSSSFGKGPYTFTSGFEGPWTSTPTKWSNEYFRNLLNYNWSSHIGPGGHYQWSNKVTKTMMLTTDVSLINDAKYLPIVELFAHDINALNEAFSHAWYKLVTRDMGPITRCTGNLIPPAQPFQNPLPDSPRVAADFSTVRRLLVNALTQQEFMIPHLMRLAYQCSSTFRSTDYQGGCNGARIRFSPENTWAVNKGTDKTISWLERNVINHYKGPGSLSFADTIVFAGQVAVELSSGVKLPFCSGRSDAKDGAGSEFLTPRIYDDSTIENTILHVTDLQKISGLTASEYIVLQGRLRTAYQQQAIGYSGTWNSDSQLLVLSNSYFSTLLSNTWVQQTSHSGRQEFAAAEASEVYMSPQDVAFLNEPSYRAIVEKYAADNSLFLEDFAKAWSKLANIDRFSGPAGNVCEVEALIQ